MRTFTIGVRMPDGELRVYHMDAENHLEARAQAKDLIFPAPRVVLAAERTPAFTVGLAPEAA